MFGFGPVPFQKVAYLHFLFPQNVYLCQKDFFRALCVQVVDCVTGRSVVDPL